MYFKPQVVFLVGLPGSGKTTWTKRFLKIHPNFHVASSDAHIETIAANKGITYSDAIAQHFKQANRAFFSDLAGHANERRNVIIDRTNLNAIGRAKALGYFPSHYQRIAVIFPDDPSSIEAVRISRIATGKDIPASAISNMRMSFEYPRTDEFDLIISPDDSFPEPPLLHGPSKPKEPQRISPSTLDRK